MEQNSTLYNLYFSLLIIIGCLSLPAAGKNTHTHDQLLWKSGEGSYKGYRIPSVIVSKRGTVLAFAEGRNSGGDNGDIDVVIRRSADDGKTWEPETVVWSEGLNSCGNPCPVVDEETGRIWLWMTWNSGGDFEAEIIQKKSQFSRLPFVCYSDDDGLTWSKPVDMSESCRDQSWGWYATGPGFGIQIKSGKYKGRLVIPANHSYDDPSRSIGFGPFGYGCHVLISDDHGKSWRRSTSIRPGCNESQVTELNDGTLLMNMRSYNNKFSRAISISTDGGETWGEINHDYQLVESRCQASILDYGKYKGKHCHIFSNPAVPVGRTHMTIRISRDDCHTWLHSKLLYDGPSAYSCLVRLANGNIGILFETGEKDAYETLRFISIAPGRLFDGLNSLCDD
ncbi:MAG: sialidase family protein [Prolixibacteraceae bacterium]